MRRRRLPILILLAVCCSPAAIIDRIAVSVGNRVVTRSDIEREIRVTALLNGTPVDLSPQNRRKTAELMIDQKLVRRELETSRYPTPGPEEVEPLYKNIAARYKTESAFADALASYGIAAQDLKDALLWQLTFLRFIEVRFRPAVQVSNREMRDYFERVVKPAAQAANPGRTIVFGDYRAEIEKTLYGKRVDEQVEQWLKDARKRTAIDYHQEAFQ